MSPREWVDMHTQSLSEEVMYSCTEHFPASSTESKHSTRTAMALHLHLVFL